MGLFQGLAVLPGVSRSGTTICAGLIMGKDKNEVAEFSFLMSIPIILASMALEIYQYIVGGFVLQILWYEMIFGFVVALLYFIIRMGINPLKIWKDNYKS